MTQANPRSLRSSNPDPSTVPAEPKWFVDCFDEAYIDLDVLRHPPDRNRLEVDHLIRRLDIQKHESWLDVCCGYGRHAIPLAKAGMQVTGFDYTQYFLDKARRDSRKQGVRIEWVRGDVREMDFEPVFDAAINMFTSIGFFPTEQENFEVVRRAAVALKPGGRFLLDTINREYIVRHFQPTHWQPLGRGVLIERRRMDWHTGYMHSVRTLIDPRRRRRRQEFYIRLYTLAELVGMFERTGLIVQHVFGGFDGSAYSPDAQRMILLGRRPKGPVTSGADAH